MPTKSLTVTLSTSRRGNISRKVRLKTTKINPILAIKKVEIASIRVKLIITKRNFTTKSITIMVLSNKLINHSLRTVEVTVTDKTMSITIITKITTDKRPLTTDRKD
jgi:hypothetical protein